jgi:hypothetical protein
VGWRAGARIGVNPYELGFIGSTDTHLGTPGAVSERAHIGTFGESAEDALTLGNKTRPSASNSAGGLAGVYAEENTRDAIFAALARREVFATSGTRIQPRFYAGWDLPELCASEQLAATGDASGVPMGRTLPPRPSPNATLRFNVSARGDPLGAPLQRLQIVKAWLGADGQFNQAVHDIAVAKSDSSVDTSTCELTGSGPQSMCASWTDPAIDATPAAIYYARIVEDPSCRWTTWKCNSLPPHLRPDACTDPRVPKTIQERAWTSPIWLTPSAD